MISVCMPYYDRFEAFCYGLASLESNYYAENLEIVVADDGSPEPLTDVRSILDIHVINMAGPKPPKNPCVPINIAVAHASGDIIALTNPEIIHKEPVIRTLLAHLRHVDDYVIACCRNQHTGRWLVKPGLEYEHPVPKGAGFHFFAMLHRELWHKAGGFDHEYRDGQGFEDNDWLWRLHMVGARFKIVEDAVVYHPPSRTNWPKGGLARNRELLRRNWGMVWNQLS